jgi:glycosyltransferase involved in cell wall biosynthesis
MKNFQKVALVHDWLVTMRGGEKVFEVLCELFPNADVFTLVHKRGSGASAIERMKITTSSLQHLPFGVTKYQYYLPLHRKFISEFDLREYDLVISSSHAVAKAVRVNPNGLHICYCHTPMRYIWDQYEQYFGPRRSNVLARTVMKMLLPSLRRWDVETSKTVHHFITNSENVRKRIQRIYGRNATVIYPPVDVEKFSLSEKDDCYYLIVSALVPYKRIDLAIETFNRSDERLVIIGNGVEETKLKAIAKKNIEFVDWVSEGELAKYYAGCRALIFPGEEDFGIVPVEAMACGKPVIAYGKGGALESVVDGTTGVFFHEQNVVSLEDALRRFAIVKFHPETIRARAMRFERKRFVEEMREYIKKKGGTYQKDI